MSVVGIDLGTQFSKVAVAFQKKITMVPNDQSKFETTTLVTYTDKQREIGEAAETTFNRHFKNTVCQAKRYLGRDADDPTLAEESHRWNYCKLGRSDEGKVLFNVTTAEGKQDLSPEQVLAPFLRQLKEFTSKHLQGLPVKDCVITCPVYFTDAQRRSLLATAALAELNVLRLLNETTAVAVTYGLTRKLEENRRVMFVDMGYSNTQVSIVDFGPGQLEMYVTNSDAFLGARDFDFALFEHFRKQFETQHKGVSLAEDARARIRLMKGVERVKKILTGNKEAVLMLECLANEIDFNLRITRDEFDVLCRPLLERLSICVGKAVAEMRARDAKKSAAKQPSPNTDANANGDNATAATTNANATETKASKPLSIDSIEVTGGASRIRCVQEGLVEILKKHIPDSTIDKCRTTLNGDECVARGAVLMCAMLSSGFKVRDFKVQDTNQWPVLMSYAGAPGADGSETQTRQIVIQRYAPSPCTAKITFHKKESFAVAFEHPKDETKEHYSDLMNVEYPLKCNLAIGKFQVEMVNLLPNQAKDPQIKLVLALNKHGLLEQPQAELIEFVKVEPEKKAEAMEGIIIIIFFLHNLKKVMTTLFFVDEQSIVDKPATETPADASANKSEEKQTESSKSENVTNADSQQTGPNKEENQNKPDAEMVDKDKAKPSEPEKSESKTDDKTKPAPKKKEKKK
ncbi:heat shock protein [Reticulomyxa filosa]|uniref:Heat shock protein n=1 Tax=Reticulomyxa filosa TaxID=46433 RepID=X6NPZ9_RETFI|nr:heat shock protein [Reticulomyxa filosa]|eukprot:ETO28096.1 heat shock protein [Reticulomyxa filosa]